MLKIKGERGRMLINNQHLSKDYTRHNHTKISLINLMTTRIGIDHIGYKREMRIIKDLYNCQIMLKITLVISGLQNRAP
jgi:hypothetical protein